AAPEARLPADQRTRPDRPAERRLWRRDRPDFRLLLLRRGLIMVWRSDLIDRRSFMRAGGIGFAAALSPRALMALAPADAVLAAGCRAADGTLGIATVSERGEIVDRTALPARAHGMAFSAAAGRLVAFARRPGTFAMVTDPSGNAAPIMVSAPDGRHFYGHGTFSPDGRLLYASEN